MYVQAFRLSVFLFILPLFFVSCFQEDSTVVACFQIEQDTVLVDQEVVFTTCSQDADWHDWKIEVGDSVYYNSADSSEINEEDMSVFRYTFSVQKRYEVKLFANRFPNYIDSIEQYIVVLDEWPSDETDDETEE